MQLGVHFANFTLPGPTRDLPVVLGDTAEAAEEAGAAWFTVMDHWFQMEQLGGPDAADAGGLHDARLRRGPDQHDDASGVLVTGVTYRHPGLLAKTVTTLDVLSQGRAMLGIGAAWYEREHLGLGVPYPEHEPSASNGSRRRCRSARQMWSDDDGPYEGKHYALASTLCNPQARSARRGRRSSIGGVGEQQDVAPGRPLRGRDEHVRDGAGRPRAQGRGAATGTARPRAATPPRSS